MSSLNDFPSFELSDKRTIREINGYLEEGSNEVLVFNEELAYPLIDIYKKPKIRSLLSNRKPEDLFLEKPVSHWNKAFYLWKNQGLVQSLIHLSSVDDNSLYCQSLWQKSIKALSTFFLRIYYFIISIHHHFYPFSALSDDELCSFFGRCIDPKGDIICFSWHPNQNKCAIGLSNHDVYIYTSGLENSQLLKHPLQKKLTDLTWQPNNNILAVACQSILLIWNLNSIDNCKDQLINLVNVIKVNITCPITSINYDPSGDYLAVCGPRSSTIMLIKNNKAMNQYEKILVRNWETGFTQIKWSPDKMRVFAASTSPHIRIFESINWSSSKWGQELKSVCQCACWSQPDGKYFLFATKDDSFVYALAFYDKAQANYIGGFSKTCKQVLDVSEITLNTGVKVGGRVHDMIWDQNGQRLVISFKDNPEYIAVYKTSTKSVLEFSAIGFIHGLKGEKPFLISFHHYFKHGSLLTISWSSEVTSYIPLQYEPKKNESSVNFNGTPRSLVSFCISTPNSGRLSASSPFVSRDSVLSPREPMLFSRIKSSPASS